MDTGVVKTERDSGTAGRILAAAKELVLKRGVKGVTVAEIATRAHVGKGTPYLYWPTKEDLIFDLFAGEFLAFADDGIAALTADPELCRPNRLCPHLVCCALGRPFVRAMVLGDADVLGALAGHPRSEELLAALSPAALLTAALPLWRRHGLVRDGWAVEEQAYALHALMVGFSQAITRTQVPGDLTVTDPVAVMSAAVTALLGVQRDGRADVHAAADEGIGLLSERKEAASALVTARETEKAKASAPVRRG
ncbi:TetR/AcrR family transcriptional regulator [Streptomyces daliensis]|uniref:Helix-turn-helix transcriptional regulator n=1 Tax=Streptomyces daliensis TaxID=299421 RepID=A0A8T4ISM8_9ACTN|nr:helix-turn-helix transcriptional regulator [Streptomyces daliensis]